MRTPENTQNDAHSIISYAATSSEVAAAATRNQRVNNTLARATAQAPPGAQCVRVVSSTCAVAFITYVWMRVYVRTHARTHSAECGRYP